MRSIVFTLLAAGILCTLFFLNGGGIDEFNHEPPIALKHAGFQSRSLQSVNSQWNNTGSTENTCSEAQINPFASYYNPLCSTTTAVDEAPDKHDEILEFQLMGQVDIIEANLTLNVDETVSQVKNRSFNEARIYHGLKIQCQQLQTSFNTPDCIKLLAVAEEYRTELSNRIRNGDTDSAKYYLMDVLGPQVETTEYTLPNGKDFHAAVALVEGLANSESVARDLLEAISNMQKFQSLTPTESETLLSANTDPSASQ